MPGMGRAGAEVAGAGGGRQKAHLGEPFGLAVGGLAAQQGGGGTRPTGGHVQEHRQGNQDCDELLPHIRYVQSVIKD